MKARQKQIEDKIADIDALMTVIDTGKDAQGHRVIVNGVMMGEVLKQHYTELGRLHPNTFLLVPGVRPAGSEAGDQKRVGTPRQAVQDGASMIVVGRPIRDAPEPYEATKGILAELEADQC